MKFSYWFPHIDYFKNTFNQTCICVFVKAKLPKNSKFNLHDWLDPRAYFWRRLKFICSTVFSDVDCVRYVKNHWILQDISWWPTSFFNTYTMLQHLLKCTLYHPIHCYFTDGILWCQSMKFDFVIICHDITITYIFFMKNDMIILFFI